MSAPSSSSSVCKRRGTINAAGRDPRYSYCVHRTRSVSCVPRASAVTPYGCHSLRRERCIVLCIDDCSYRVHSSVLAKNSRIFEQRLATDHVQGDASDWHVEDIVLTGDSKHQWDAMLDALYDADQYFKDLRSEPFEKSLPTLAGLLKLAHKYGMDFHEQKVIAIIASYFPSPSSPLALDARPTLAQATTVIRLARATSATALLRPAYLIVAAHAADSDKSIVHDLDILTIDKVSICGGMLALLKAQRAHMFPFFTRFARPAACKTGRCVPLQHAQRYIDAPERVWLLVDEPLSWLREDDPSPMCDVCLASISQTFAQGCRGVWARVDKIFRLY
ncbi:hypothetical protein BD626DRAFT_631236 [Schizophyllum amplum]|uniref:BTB domain-containing protein n=1 Tax=Schizophyllum amplum TaxID=97359 RepID=A0A550CB69_9AGAR|nr:hypothetical protein BD626DRAFT_631236 [Auriculariopsis ampla]